MPYEEITYLKLERLVKLSDSSACTGRSGGRGFGEIGTATWSDSPAPAPAEVEPAQAVDPAVIARQTCSNASAPPAPWPGPGRAGSSEAPDHSRFPLAVPGPAGYTKPDTESEPGSSRGYWQWTD